VTLQENPDSWKTQHSRLRKFARSGKPQFGALRHTLRMILDAIRNGNADEVRSLLAADPSVYSARTGEGASAVLWAVYTRHSDLAPILLGSRKPDFFEAC